MDFLPKSRLLRYGLYGLGGFFICILLLIAIFYRADMPLDELKKRYAGNPSKFVKIQGMDAHYRAEGSGHCLLLLHGTAASLHTWDGWTKILEKDFAVYRMDLPAFGMTGPHPKRDYSIASYVSFVNAFMEKMDLKRCHIAGNSLGGLIAWRFAVKHPAKVRRMILLDAAGYKRKGRPFIFTLARTPVLADIMKKLTPRFVIADNIRQVYGDDSLVTEELIDRYHAFALRPGNRQAFIDRANTDYKDGAPEIKKIKVPTLIQWGSADIWIPPRFAKMFHKDIAGSELIIYEGAGHIPMEEIPKKTALDARKFLTQADAQDNPNGPAPGQTAAIQP